MEKIELTTQEKNLLMLLQKKDGYLSNMHSDCSGGLLLLEQKGFVINSQASDNSIYCTHWTDKARAYIAFNPKLKNPSMWDDKKYIINTAISVIAIIISAAALYISIKNK